MTEHTEEMPKATEVNVLDLLDKGGLINVPTDELEVYVDADAALKIELIREEQEKYPAVTTRTMASLTSPDVEESVRPAQWHALEEQANALIDRMKNSKMIFKFEGLAPIMRDVLLDAAKVACGKHFEGKETPSQKDEAEFQSTWFTYELITRQLKAIEIPGGVQTEFTHAGVQAIIERLYEGDQSRVIECAYRLFNASATSSVINDAGFRGRVSDATS